MARLGSEQQAVLAAQAGRRESCGDRFLFVFQAYVQQPLCSLLARVDCKPCSLLARVDRKVTLRGPRRQLCKGRAPGSKLGALRTHQNS